MGAGELKAKTYRRRLFPVSDDSIHRRNRAFGKSETAGFRTDIKVGKAAPGGLNPQDVFMEDNPDRPSRHDSLPGAASNARFCR